MGSARRLGAVGVLTIAFSTLVALSPSARANKLVTVTIPAPKGEISSKWLSYSGPPRANVLLPDHYNPGKRYPLVVVLNGLNCNYDWYVHTGVISVFKGLEAIVVMPEGGNGWYADWWNDGERGGPSWETYELETVLPTILHRYRILPQRRYHAIVGHSMGGLGAVYLGGRLPGFFGSVATTSGFVDPQLVAQITQPGMGLTAYAPFEGDYALDPVEGPPQGFYADGHNPTRLAMNLEQTRVFVSTGTGVPSSAGLASLTKGGEASIAEGSALEGLIIYPMNQLYDKALRSAGVDFTYQVHSGGHDIPDNIGSVYPPFSKAWAQDGAAAVTWPPRSLGRPARSGCWGVVPRVHGAVRRRRATARLGRDRSERLDGQLLRRGLPRRDLRRCVPELFDADQLQGASGTRNRPSNQDARCERTSLRTRNPVPGQNGGPPLDYVPCRRRRSVHRRPLDECVGELDGAIPNINVRC